ncbi:Pyridoxal 4-dehydrogenase [Planctomycetes bacterium MalM25]|nr:Pyridoxal 4-dehydrogenase [Planctomycetes bacterium MalM25]
MSSASPLPGATNDPVMPRVSLPRVVFGSSALGNLYQALPFERKIELVSGWFEHGEEPVVIDTAGKYGAGLALESIGDCLRELKIAPEQVRVGNKLGWYRIPMVGDEPSFEPDAWIDLENDAEQRLNAEGIVECWEQGNELLGEPYRPSMISVHDPDEYLAAAADEADRERRGADLLAAYGELSKIRDSEPGVTLGVGSKDWRVVRDLAGRVDFDWVMLANCVTAYTHPAESLEFIDRLSKRGVAVVNSGVFNAGFLVGGAYFDYHPVERASEPELFDWRDRFDQLCEKHGVNRAHACIQFGLSPPGVQSVALSTTSPGRIAQNIRYANEATPAAFWAEAKQIGLVAKDYPYLG